MKSEFDVYEMLDGKAIPLDFHSHPLHRIVTQALVPFWVDLVENSVRIIVDNTSEKVFVDYRSFSVALCHIFDNATKYVASGTDLHISFKPSGKQLAILFEMTSLKIEKAEVAMLFTEEYRGQWAKKTDTAGAGIGLNVVRKLIEMNKGIFSIYVDVNPTYRKRIDSIPYERNIFEFLVNKAN